MLPASLGRDKVPQVYVPKHEARYKNVGAPNRCVSEPNLVSASVNCCVDYVVEDSCQDTYSISYSCAASISLNEVVFAN